MTPKELQNPRASPRIACYGTAYLADAAVDAKLVMRGIAGEVPRFSSPRMDASFLINCGRFLSGGFATMETPSTYVKRVAGSDFRSSKGTVIYECSTELRLLLAALTAERAAEMAARWYDIYGQPKTKSAKPNGRTQIRLAILKNLVVLANQAKDNHKRLVLRVDYRKQRKVFTKAVA